MSDERIPRRIVDWTPGGSRPRGPPRTKWMDVTLRDLQSCRSHSMDEAVRRAPDRAMTNDDGESAIQCFNRYYTLESNDHAHINTYLSSLVEKSISTLQNSYCVAMAEDEVSVSALNPGRIASYYYLNHKTLRMFIDTLNSQTTVPGVIDILSKAHEYAELPVRHNEDQINSELAKRVPLEVDQHSFDSPHTKAFILLQAHFERGQLPSSDYYTDTKSVLDQAIRILQAMLDIAADQGWLLTSLHIMLGIQMVVQGRWSNNSSLLTLPHFTPYHVEYLGQPRQDGPAKKGSPQNRPIECIPELLVTWNGKYETLETLLGEHLEKAQLEQVHLVLFQLPQLDVSLSLKGWWCDCGDREDVRPVTTGDGARGDWMMVHADQEYILHVTLTRRNRHKKSDSKAHAPHFPKPKDEGWFLLLGNVETSEVVAMKRVGCIHQTSTSRVSFFTPDRLGRCVYSLYLMSDAYLGLDQQYEIQLDVIAPDIASQVNTELKDMDFSLDS